MMEEEQYEKRLSRRRAGVVVVTLLALAISSNSAVAQSRPGGMAPQRERAPQRDGAVNAAQSTDRNNPEPLRVNRIQGGKEAGTLKVYYYTFVAGPGGISIHLISSIGARDGGANVRMADVRFFDLNANNLFSLKLIGGRNDTTGRNITESITSSFGITRRQQLLMEVTLYEPVVRYQVSIDGAVELGQSLSSSMPGRDRRERDDRSSGTPPPYLPGRGGRERGDPPSGTGGANTEEPRRPGNEPNTTPSKVGEVNTEKRVALVIGNSDYKSKPLNNPLNDARDMAQMLRDCGFEVIQRENLTRREMIEQIRDFGKKLKAGGVGLFYYSGHGVQVKGVNYLIPIGHNIGKEQDVEFEAVDASQVISEMGAAENQLNIVILDACRDNPLPGSTRSGTRGLAVMTANSGEIIAYSTAAGSVASDGEGRNGLYTQELLTNMREPGLKIEEVFKRVRVGVREKSKGKQVPYESTALDGDFYFVKKSQRQ
jgi:Caspase domain